MVIWRQARLSSINRAPTSPSVHHKPGALISAEASRMFWTSTTTVRAVWRRRPLALKVEETSDGRYRTNSYYGGPVIIFLIPPRRVGRDKQYLRWWPPPHGHNWLSGEVHTDAPAIRNERRRRNSPNIFWIQGVFQRWKPTDDGPNILSEKSRRTRPVCHIFQFRWIRMKVAWPANTRTGTQFEISELAQVTLDRFNQDAKAHLKRLNNIVR